MRDYLIFTFVLLGGLIALGALLNAIPPAITPTHCVATLKDTPAS